MAPWRAGPALSRNDRVALRRRMIFQYNKWDPQAGDVDVLAPYPILLDQPTWNKLARWSEQLAHEMLAAEAELVGRPDLHRQLGLPRAVRTMLSRAATVGPARNGPRYTRFDWHLTTQGWRISEANADVPGGIIEGTGLTQAVAEHFPEACVAGDPGADLADALASTCKASGSVALVHATAYTDDRQVMVYLQRELRSRGIQAHLVAPDQITWRNGQACIQSDWFTGPADAVFRFFPAEWLANLPRCSGREGFFFGTTTPQCNPASALLVQSKRFPLVWDQLKTPLPTWREMLPETCDPRHADWRRSSEWIVKPALGRVGDGIGMRGLTPAKEWKRIARSVWLFPRYWAAQTRFTAVPLTTPDGDRYPCIGVFVIDGRAAGAYGRLARAPLIDSKAQDVAVLIEGVPVEVCGGRDGLVAAC